MSNTSVEDSFFYKSPINGNESHAINNADLDKLPMCLKNDEVEDYLELKETDPIFSTSYEMMIKEAFRADKHFILAKMKTRSTSSYTQCHAHYFNIYGILKIIFKKRLEEIVGRFHHLHPMSAKNPLTNNQIIGEVEFYIFLNPYLSFPAENRYPQGQTLSLQGVKGKFMGTDFNYLYSEDIRKSINDNCLEANLSLLTFEDYHDPMNSDWQQFLDRNVTDVQFQNDIQEIIQSSFIHSNKFYIHGALACIYFLAVITTFLAGLSSYFDKNDDGEVTLYIEPYTFILPVSVIVFDCDMRRVYKRAEKRTFTVIKIIFWITFYVLFGIAINQETNSIIEFVNLMFLVWPCAGVCYSFLLMKFNYFSYPLPNQDGEQLQRFENVLNQRHQQVEQRQQQFDEQNFGGEQLFAIDINSNSENIAHNNQHDIGNGVNDNESHQENEQMAQKSNDYSQMNEIPAVKENYEHSSLQ